jgi:hypothetical protein
MPFARKAWIMSMVVAEKPFMNIVIWIPTGRTHEQGLVQVGPHRDRDAGYLSALRTDDAI